MQKIELNMDMQRKGEEGEKTEQEKDDLELNN